MAEENALPVPFALPGRESLEVVLRQAGQVKNLPWVSHLANAMLNVVLILNSRRQVVFATENIKELLPDDSLEQMLGMFSGEVLGCKNSQVGPGGCGTSLHCTQCGATRAVLSALAGRADVQECRILVNSPRITMDALDLRVVATPLQVEGENYCILAISDISHEKRRRALERIFFHDLLNIAGGVEGLAGLLANTAPESMQRDLQLLQNGVRDMLDEIEAQKELVAAENHELLVTPQKVDTGELLEQLGRRYQHNLVARNKSLVIDGDSAKVSMVTDPVLLRRCIGNLLKNALEASRTGQRVTLGCTQEGDWVHFRVHNVAVMPPQVQLQVFQRSFSTKGAGRGLGTFSVKLLAEKYLCGRVAFVSNDGGTTFTITLPRELSPDKLA